MRLCRYRHLNQTQVGFFGDDHVIPVAAAAQACAASTGNSEPEMSGDHLLDLLPPEGRWADRVRRLESWLTGAGPSAAAALALPLNAVELLVPCPRPNKLFLLAGNYAEHIREGGGVASERSETFPYVFMKPPTTTLTDPGKPVRIPGVSPHAIDWELELAVVIGRRGKQIAEAEALRYVAGYTIINDISDRRFRPNPQRQKRERDAFFDWLHGKWHDSFCPCGPCLLSADDLPDPQTLTMQLTVNGRLFQNASTAQQIFPVAAVIEFISSFVTLEPGDIISTGTAAGVGNSTQTYLQPGDRIEASIQSIGTLVTPVTAE